MRSRFARITVLGLLALMLAPGPVLAFDSVDSDCGCCCASKLKCRASASRVGKAPTCCKPVQSAPAPITDPVDAVAPPNTDGVSAEIDDVPTAITEVRVADRPNDIEEPAPSGVALFTLHAAFLI